VSLLVGHFGSGKTEIAINGALGLAARGIAVTLADLDVVKPYFRSRSARALLAEAGVGLLAPEGEHFHADLPIVVPQVRNLLRDPAHKLVMDVGGDDTGARVLGSLADVMPADDSECLVVLNFRRPFTRDPDEATEMVRQIERAARVPVAGLVSNTHLMEHTTSEIVEEGYRKAEETARRLGIEVVAVTVVEGLVSGFDEKIFDCPVMRLRRVVRPPFESSPEQRTSGPLFVLN